MVAAPNHESHIELPRGLRVRVLAPAAAGDGLALEAVVRRVGVAEVALGVLRLPAGASALIGKPVTLAAQLHARMYALDATVLGIEQVPRALVVTMPTEARRTEQRQHYRLNCNIEALASWHGVDERLAWKPFERQPARLLDLSGGGALLRTHALVPENATVRLEFTLEGENEPLDVSGRAVRVQQERSGLAFRINTEFEGINRRTQEQVIRFIFRQQALRTQRRSQ